MRHLYQQIFASIVGVAVVCGALAIGVASVFSTREEMPSIVYESARYLGSDLPSERRALRRELRRRSRRSHMALSLWSPERRLLVRAGPRLPRPRRAVDGPYWFERRRHRGVVMPLEDGRILVVGQRHHRSHPGPLRMAGALVILLGLVLLGSYWAARRVTRRLEMLGAGVRRLGAGEAGVRVEVDGQDEVAELARQFNATSERIETLLVQQQRVLAGASHELRSPLARLRMALELLADPAATRPERRGELLRECERDIEELDALVDDILLGARLRDRSAVRRFERVDLGQLVVSEAERAGAGCDVGPCVVQGDERALRSLIRNLLENAKRYGAPPVVVGLRAEGETLRLRVEDAGPPIAVEDRERIFEPFFRPRGRPEGQGGAGLGLSLVRDVARHHGGDVRYEVSASGGSRFVVELAPEPPA